LRSAPDARPGKKPKSIERGRPWLACVVISNIYNHILPPNGPSCTNGELLEKGAFTASSFHGQGINTAMADGGIRFAPDSIDLTVWRAIGSRAGDP